MRNKGRIAGLLLVVGAFCACSDPKKNCAVDTDCGNGQFCAPAGCTWGCFQEGVGCREGGWCHPVSGQCMSELPALSDFKATPSSIGAGGSSTLEWTVLGADTLTIEPGSVDVTGTSATVVSPDVTTVYTLTATNTFGTVSATVKVDVAILTCEKDGDCTQAGLICNEKWKICVVGDCAGRADFTPCEVQIPKYSYNICVAGTCVEPGCGDETCNVPGPHFPLADTGQRKCYSDTAEIACPAQGAAFYGQDAQYGWDASHPDKNERFTRDDTTDPAKPVVVDHVTGLTWQDGFGKELSWSDGFSYCDTLEWGGYKDWRLPDIYELESISDMGIPDSAIDHDFFASIAASSRPFWTSISMGSISIPLGSFSFSDGGILFWDLESNKHAMCVRSEPSSSLATRFNRSSGKQPVVKDSVTNLVWQGCRAGLSGQECGSPDTISCSNQNFCTWKEALAYCEGLDWGTYQDWRLPNQKELLSIVNYRQIQSPYIDSASFPSTAETFYWSSSSSAVDTNCARIVAFNHDSVNALVKTSWYHVRCVRGGQ